MTADTVGGVWTYALELARRARAARRRGGARDDGPRRSTRDQRADARALAASSARTSRRSRSSGWTSRGTTSTRAGEWLLELERDVAARRRPPERLRPRRAAVGRAGASSSRTRACCRGGEAVHGEPRRPGVGRATARAVDARAARGATLVVAPTRGDARRARARTTAVARRAVVIPNGARRRRPRPAREGAVRARPPAGLGRGEERRGARRASRRALPWPVVARRRRRRPDVAAARSARARRAALDDAALARGVDLRRAGALRAVRPRGRSRRRCAGCALVLGDIPSLREVWGDAALFVAARRRRRARGARCAR